MKIYAKQVPPEYQESPLFMEEWPENVYVFGNRYFRDHGAEYIENIKNLMYDAADELKQLQRGRYGAAGESYDLNDFLRYYVPRDDGRQYTRADRLQWRELLLSFDYYSDIDDDAITTALQLITGDEYDAAQICGCCQGDWNNIIYPTKYGREWLREFEIEYFNTGAEWRISENDPDNDDNYYMYTHEWRDDGIRAEIADAAGVDPADVVLYVFDGYTQTARYKAVTA